MPKKFCEQIISVLNKKTSKFEVFWHEIVTSKSMSKLNKTFFVSGNEKGGYFQLIRTTIVLLLVLCFEGVMVYIMVSSLL